MRLEGGPSKLLGNWLQMVGCSPLGPVRAQRRGVAPQVGRARAAAAAHRLAHRHVLRKGNSQYQDIGVKPRGTRVGIRKGGKTRRAPTQDPSTNIRSSGRREGILKREGRAIAQQGCALPPTRGGAPLQYQTTSILGKGVSQGTANAGVSYGLRRGFVPGGWAFTNPGNRLQMFGYLPPF